MSEKLVNIPGYDYDSIYPCSKRIKFKWRWIKEGDLSWPVGDPRNKSKKRKPCQSSEAELGKGWVLQAVYFSKEYEAMVVRYDNVVEEYTIQDFHTGEDTNKPLLTRLDAQVKAEELFVEIGKWILNRSKRIGEM